MADNVINIEVKIERVTITIIPSVVLSINGIGSNIRAKEERLDVDVARQAEFFEALNAICAEFAVPLPPAGGGIISPEPLK
jgi:hypothetical protein